MRFNSSQLTEVTHQSYEHNKTVTTNFQHFILTITIHRLFQALYNDGQRDKKCNIQKIYGTQEKKGETAGNLLGEFVPMDG